MLCSETTMNTVNTYHPSYQQPDPSEEFQ